MAIWATLAAALFVGVAIFQVGLALGAPWGAHAYGGRAVGPDGRLPGAFRGMSALAALFGLFAAVIVLGQGEVIELGGVADSTLTAITWALAGLMLVNTLANATSTSRIERMALGGATGFLTICCVVLALGG